MAQTQLTDLMIKQVFYFIALLTLLWHVSGEFQLPEHCYRLSRGSGVIHSFGKKDDGFSITIRRSPDGAQVGNWFEPEREYLVTLENKLPLVTFDDFLFWLKPTEPLMMGQPDSMNVSQLLIRLHHDVLLTHTLLPSDIQNFPFICKVGLRSSVKIGLHTPG